MTKTTGHQIRIESNPNPTGRKHTWLGDGGRILIDGQDVSGQVAAIDIHLQPGSTPVATVQMMGLDLAISAEEAEAEPTTACGTPSPFYQHGVPMDPPCQLPAGHAGQHRSGPGSWGDATAPAATRLLLCVPCYAEQIAGQRDEANPAILVVGGMSTCDEHLTIQQGPVIPGRTASGLIPGNGAAS